MAKDEEVEWRRMRRLNPQRPSKVLPISAKEPFKVYSIDYRRGPRIRR